MCIYVCHIYIYRYLGNQNGAPDTLLLKLEMVMSYLVWVLETELRSLEDQQLFLTLGHFSSRH